MKVSNDEVIRKIIGLMQVLGNEQVPYVKIAFEDDMNVLIQDWSSTIVRVKKLSWDEFVSTDSKLLVQIIRSMQDGE